MKRLLVFSMVAIGGFGQNIQVHGHRGARAMRPENTLPAFEYAIAQGVDALEDGVCEGANDHLVRDRERRLGADCQDGKILRDGHGRWI